MDETEQVKKGFWPKVRKTLGKVPFVPDAVAMYYCMLDPATPLWAKASIAGALAYFISPLDAIPDFLGALGYTDDAAVVLGTLKLIHAHLTDEHRARARDALR